VCGVGPPLGGRRADPDGVSEQTISLRRATKADVALVRELRLRMLTDSPAAFDADYDAAHSHDDAGWRDWIGAGSGEHQRVVWIATTEAEAVGTIAAGVVADECRIGALWVTPSVRGAGIGGALIDAAETWGRDTRCRWSVLSVSEENPAAQRLYLRRGYELTGASKPTRWGHRELHMRKATGR
jgi:GNAT superfamily N-acetyltransferase